MSVAQWEETSAIAMERLRQELGIGRSAVVDDTFSHRFLRDRCKSVADDFGANFTVVFVATSIDDIRARRAENDKMRTRHSIRDNVFEAHYASFQFPTDDEQIVRVDASFDVNAWLAIEKEYLSQ